MKLSAKLLKVNINFSIMTEVLRGGGGTEEVLWDLLPEEYEYKLLKFEMTDFQEDNINIKHKHRLHF